MKYRTDVILTASEPSKIFYTPPSSGGIHIMWDVLDGGTPTLGTGIELNFFLVTPGGTEIPFDVNPITVDVNQIAPSAMGGATNIKVEAVGITGDIEVKVYSRGLF